VRAVSDQQPRRKVRTRGHVIADLGVNHVERQVLLAGYVAERRAFDYGIDLEMKTFDADGQVEPSHVAIQVRATDHFAPHADGATVPVRVETEHLKGWLLEWVPVVLILYDATAERAYWLAVQEYARQRDIDPDTEGESVTLAVPLANVFDPAAVRVVRDLKQQYQPPAQE
jgi:hypothetical protein